MDRSAVSNTDVALIGAGIMSATLAYILKQIDPRLTIAIFEALDDAAMESSDPWNNAGTGHAANCELNYTPQRPDGSIDLSKALQVNSQFDLSREFWSYLVEAGAIDPRGFINRVPHISFVTGVGNVDFLRRRHAALSAQHRFQGMEFTQDPEEILAWAPLVMEGRRDKEPLAATRVLTGTDVNYGALTKAILAQLGKTSGFAVHYGHRVTRLSREQTGDWQLELFNDEAQARVARAKFVFLGAGGGALPLLQRSEIEEARGYGGFPVSGIWLRCDTKSISRRHNAKVYGKAPVGSPPMSVPHLDTRIIDGKRSILFGPYAGFSTKFLKHGSYMDMFQAINPGNIQQMLSAGYDNLDLTKYLVGQVLQSSESRFGALRQFFPEAKPEDWEVQTAGQRVQTIKPNDDRRSGYLEFGTELLAASGQSLVALLGASPGASTSASIAVRVLETFFPEKMAGEWLDQVMHMMPSYKLPVDAAAACAHSRARTAEILQLESL